MGLYNTFRRKDNEGWRLEWMLPCSIRSLGVSGTHCRGAISALLWGRTRATQDKTEALDCVKFIMSLGYQHLKLFVDIPKPMLPLLIIKKIVFLRKNCNFSYALLIFRLELLCDQSKRAPNLIKCISWSHTHSTNLCRICQTKCS